MTPRPRAPTLRAVANLTIRIPDELMQRLLSATPPLDADEICTCALQEALRRRTLNEKRPVGRPAPSIEKVRKTYNLDSDVTDRISELAKTEPAASESAIVNRLLRAALFSDGA